MLNIYKSETFVNVKHLGRIKLGKKTNLLLTFLGKKAALAEQDLL